MIDEEPREPPTDDSDNAGDPEVPVIHRHSESVSHHHALEQHLARHNYIKTALQWCRDRLRLPGSTFWMVIATIAIAVANGYYVHYARLQWQKMGEQLTQSNSASDLASKAAKDAHDSFVAGNRPWLDLDAAIAGPLTFNKGVARVGIKLTYKNVGHSTAMSVAGFPILEELAGGSPEPSSLLLQACASATQQSAYGEAYKNIAVFPGQTIEKTVTLPLIGPRSQSIPPSPYIYPNVVWCVGYRPDFTEAQYHTAYIWMIDRKDPKSPSGFIPIDPRQGAVPATELRLIPSPYAGTYAK